MSYASLPRVYVSKMNYDWFAPEIRGIEVSVAPMCRARAGVVGGRRRKGRHCLGEIASMSVLLVG